MLRHLPRPLADAFGHLVESIADLADVLAQAVELALEAVGDVDPDVGVLRRRHEHFAHLVGQQVVDQQLGEDVRVARRRVDGVQAGVTRGAMVGMIEVAIAAETHRRILANHRVGAKTSDFADDVAPQLDGVAQRASS